MDRKDKEGQTGREAATEPRVPRDVVRRARENSTGVRNLEGLDVTPSARDNVEWTRQLDVTPSARDNVEWTRQPPQEKEAKATQTVVAVQFMFVYCC